MRELARAGLGEIHAVVRTQLSDLALEVGPLLQEAAGLVDKSVPDIDIGDAGLAGGLAIQRIKEQHIRRRLGAAHCGQANPQHRHTLGFHDADHLVDFPGVEFDPALLAKLVKAVRRARALLRRGGRRRIAVVGGIVRRQFGIDRFVVGLCGSIGCATRLRAGFLVSRLGLRFGFGVLLVGLFVG